MKIRVCTCEDDPVFRNLLVSFINKEADMEIVGSVGSKVDLMKLLPTIPVDVLLLDMNLSGNDQGGLDVALETRWLGLELKIIVLSSFDMQEMIHQAMTFGRVINYITKEHYRDIPDAIRQAHANQSGIHHSSARLLVSQLMDTEELKLKSRITGLQLQILRLLSEGYDYHQIAEKLFYNYQSIKNEICKVTKVFKGKFPYLEWLRLKKQNTDEIVELAKRLKIIP